MARKRAQKPPVATPPTLVIRDRGAYEVTAQDHGYFYQLLQNHKTESESDLILLRPDEIDTLHAFVHRNDPPLKETQ